ncbi:MAG: hypothetical protein ACYDA9_14345 [Terriglobia bacterium]
MFIELLTLHPEETMMKASDPVEKFQTLKAPMSCSACLPLVLLLVLGACSKPVSNTGAAAASQGATNTAASAPAGNACDRKLVTTADAADILGGPVASEKTLPGDAQSCVFTKADLTTLTIALRPGLGRATVDTWASGKMPVQATSISGVGERAVWQSTLKEVIAEKNNVLCDVGVVGPGHVAGATQEKLGALCNKIFAAM